MRKTVLNSKKYLAELEKGFGYCKDRIIEFYQQINCDNEEGVIEKLTGRWIKDNTASSWVVYRLPEHEKDRFTIGIASSVGCERKCSMCLSGPFVRLLDWEEIMCQVLYGFDSLVARKVFESPRRKAFCLNFTCEGEPFSNLESVMRVIIELLGIKDLKIEFIITSVGIKEKLDVFIEKYIQLPKIRHYHSVNSCIPEIRKIIMPECEEDLLALRNRYQKIAEETGEKVTESIILLPGINDTDKELEAAKELYGDGRPFKIKLQAYKSPVGYENYITATEEQLKKRQHEFRKIGIECRVRNVIGSEFFSGCGSTIVI